MALSSEQPSPFGRPRMTDWSRHAPRRFAAILDFLAERYGPFPSVDAATLADDLVAAELPGDWRFSREDQIILRVETGFPRLRIEHRGANIAYCCAAGSAGDFLENVIPQTMRNATLHPYDVAIDDRQIVFSRLMPDMLKGDRTIYDRLIIPCAPTGRAASSVLTFGARGGETPEIGGAPPASPTLAALAEATRRGRPFLGRPTEAAYA